VGGEYLKKMGLKEIGYKDWIHMARGDAGCLVSCCENHNEHSVSIKVGKFRKYLRKY
jgi:hypothetical protein